MLLKSIIIYIYSVKWTYYYYFELSFYINASHTRTVSTEWIPILWFKSIGDICYNNHSDTYYFSIDNLSTLAKFGGGHCSWPINGIIVLLRFVGITCEKSFIRMNERWHNKNSFLRTNNVSWNFYFLFISAHIINYLIVLTIIWF